MANAGIHGMLMPQIVDWFVPLSENNLPGWNFHTKSFVFPVQANNNFELQYLGQMAETILGNNTAKPVNEMQQKKTIATTVADSLVKFLLIK